MISPRMQALVTKVDAAEAAHYAGLRESAQHEKAAATAKNLSARRRPPWSASRPAAAQQPPKKKTSRAPRRTQP